MSAITIDFDGRQILPGWDIVMRLISLPDSHDWHLLEKRSYRLDEPATSIWGRWRCNLDARDRTTTKNVGLIRASLIGWLGRLVSHDTGV